VLCRLHHACLTLAVLALLQKAVDAATNGIAELTPKLKSALAPKDSPAKRGRSKAGAQQSPEEAAPPVASPRAPRSSRVKAKSVA